MTSHKQPRENITGTDRGDTDLLSLDERAQAHRDALIAMAKQLRTACGVGNPAPVVKDMADRMYSPRPGDLVVEISAMFRRDRETRTQSLGYLVEHRREWAHTDEEWVRLLAEDPEGWEGDRRTEEAWYVQYGPDPQDVCRWTNCEFMTLPLDFDPWSTDTD